MPFVWILAALAVIFVVETVLTEIEQWGWATGTLIATLVAAHFLNVFRVTDFVAEHGIGTLVYALGYLAIGVGWSFVKWFSYLRGYRDIFREHKEAFLRAENDRRLMASDVSIQETELLKLNDPVPENLLSIFRNYLRYNVSGLDYKTLSNLHSLERPRAAKNKSRITAWMAYWPCSFIGTFLNDPVRRMFNWAFTQFKTLYQKMADHVFRHDLELK